MAIDDREKVHTNVHAWEIFGLYKKKLVYARYSTYTICRVLLRDKMDALRIVFQFLQQQIYFYGYCVFRKFHTFCFSQSQAIGQYIGYSLVMSFC